MTTGSKLERLNAEIVDCRKCPRLVAWREKVAHEKIARFSSQKYWGKPVPGFGDPGARVLIVGLAPAAHGANRTGRMFTGDRSGEWLYRTLYKFGFSSRETSASAADGLRLKGCYITAVARCAPPANKLLQEEINNCEPYLLEEFSILTDLRVVVSLGKTAFDRTITSMKKLGISSFDRIPKFGHGVKVPIKEDLTIIASYHPSQQNTFTGKLTRPMFDSIFREARRLSK